MAGKCCEVGQNVPSDSCPAVHQLPSETLLVEAPIIVISVLVPVIVVLLMVVIFSCKKKKLPVSCKKKKLPVAVLVQDQESGNVQVQESGNENPSQNASKEQYPGPTAPPPPFNPQLIVQECVHVY